MKCRSLFKKMSNNMSQLCKEEKEEEQKWDKEEERLFFKVRDKNKTSMKEEKL